MQIFKGWDGRHSTLKLADDEKLPIRVDNLSKYKLHLTDKASELLDGLYEEFLSKVEEKVKEGQGLADRKREAELKDVFQQNHSIKKAFAALRGLVTTAGELFMGQLKRMIVEKGKAAPFKDDGFHMMSDDHIQFVQISVCVNIIMHTCEAFQDRNHHGEEGVE